MFKKSALSDKKVLHTRSEIMASLSAFDMIAVEQGLRLGQLNDDDREVGDA